MTSDELFKGKTVIVFSLPGTADRRGRKCTPD
ncbi:Uncharacterised protein [Vibrio cholerae]|nr:Uncharacterised protein [Vibrio cholerae]